MRELDLYRNFLRDIEGFDAKGCNKIAAELNEDYLNCLYIMTTKFYEDQEAIRMKAFQILRIHSELQSDALLQALQDMDSDSVNEVFQAVNKRLSSVSV